MRGLTFRAEHRNRVRRKRQDTFFERDGRFIHHKGVLELVFGKRGVAERNARACFADVVADQNSTFVIRFRYGANGAGCERRNDFHRSARKLRVLLRMRMALL